MQRSDFEKFDMKRFLFPLLLLGAIVVSGCTYDLGFDGKSCDTSHPCPSGYTCTNDGLCSSNGDGGEQCSSGATRCSVDNLYQEVCEDGSWQSYDCSPGHCQDGQCKNDQHCVTSDDCDEGTWCGPDDICIDKGSCEDPGVKRCDPQLRSVMVCDEESGNMVLVEECDQSQAYCDPFLVACMSYCSDDGDCQMEYTSCEPVSKKCLDMDLCTDTDSCDGSMQCVGSPGACVAGPTTTGSLPGGGGMDLQCYVGDPSGAEPSPATCNMQGGLVNFLNGEPCGEQAVGLPVAIYLLDDVLGGMTNRVVSSTYATQEQVDGQIHAVYYLEDLPTNKPLVMRVGGGDNGEFTTLYTFSIYIRSDECELSGGVVDYAAPTLYKVNYDGYSNPLSVVSNPDKGLVFGQVRDCNGKRIQHATGGLSMPHDLLYYLRGYIPDDTMTSTGSTGFFIAANAIPIRGIASVLVQISDDGSSLSLWERPMRAFPGAASLVLFQKPKAPR